MGNAVQMRYIKITRTLDEAVGKTGLHKTLKGPWLRTLGFAP